MGILGNIRDFRQVSGDTSVQKQAKERKLQEALLRINASWKGKPLSIRAAKLKDVNPGRELSPHGLEQGRALISKLRQDPASPRRADASGL